MHLIFLWQASNINYLKVYLVTGGMDSATNTLSSTEILVHGSSSWTNSAPLPTPRQALVGATLNNKIVMTGIHYYTIFEHWAIFYIHLFSLLSFFILFIYFILSTGCSWKGGTVQHSLNPWFFGLFPMFWAFFPIQYGQFSFWYSWGILLKKKSKNCILKKG